MKSLLPHLKKKVWGTESWVVSTHDNGKSLSCDGELPFVLNYLVKIIDTNKDLSIQVHPSDDNSKDESWLVLDHGEGAGIYLGFKKGVDRSHFKSTLDEKKDISKLLNFIPVTKGDFFFIPAGAIHAIGANVKLVEVQESSDTTYRVWDWNRLGCDGKPRELHVNKALDVLDFGFNKPVIINTRAMLDPTNNLFSFKDIRLEMLCVNSETQLSLELNKGESITLLSGDIHLNSNKLENETSYIATELSGVKLLSNSYGVALLVRSVQT